MKDVQMQQQINELYHIGKTQLAWVYFLNVECRDTILYGMGGFTSYLTYIIENVNETFKT